MKSVMGMSLYLTLCFYSKNKTIYFLFIILFIKKVEIETQIVLIYIFHFIVLKTLQKASYNVFAPHF